jgi:hypothetical protein
MRNFNTINKSKPIIITVDSPLVRAPGEKRSRIAPLIESPIPIIKPKTSFFLAAETKQKTPARAVIYGESSCNVMAFLL